MNGRDALLGAASTAHSDARLRGEPAAPARGRADDFSWPRAQEAPAVVQEGTGYAQEGSGVVPRSGKPSARGLEPQVGGECALKTAMRLPASLHLGSNCAWSSRKLFLGRDAKVIAIDCKKKVDRCEPGPVRETSEHE